MALSNLPDRNPFFTGREQVLMQLQEALAGQGRAALSGLGGVGKTQIAIEYAHRHSDEYDYIFWATAASREALVSRYVTIAGLLKLPQSAAQDQTLAVAAIKGWFSSNQRWLLILDNADDLAMVHEFVPPAKNGHVLLTTLARAIGAIGRLVEIREMVTEEAALFLLRRAKYIAEDPPLDEAAEADQGDAKAIASQLDGLPLALDQAGAYIEETDCRLSGYFRLYREHAPELLQRRGMLTSDHPDPVGSTWALSFDKIEQVNPAASELLKFCSFLHPDAIPEELFPEGAAELGPVLGPIGSDVLALNGAISEILKYSLLRRDRNTHTIEIHRLVQAVLRQGMDEATQRSWAERAVRAMNQAFPHVEFSSWALCDRLLPQAHACAELIKQWGFEYSEVARLLNDAGFYSYKRGRYAEAKPFYEWALAIRKKALSPEHPDVAQSLNNLARLYFVQDLYIEAEPLHKRALGIREKALGPKHPEVAYSLTHLAELYRNQREYAKAEPLYKRALAIRKKALGPQHPDVAKSLNNWAGLYYDQGQYAKAKPLYKRALAIREKALSPEHPDLAWSLNDLAQLYAEQGQYAKAEPLYKRALAIREKALGLDHPYVATSWENYALLLRKMDRSEEAERLESRAKAIRAKPR